MIPDQDIDWVRMLRNVPAGGVAFVDVGGGSGHVVSKLMEMAAGEIIGRFVLQDQKHAIESAQAATPKTSFEFMEHDFFEKQPIQGARVYPLPQMLSRLERC